MKHLGRFNWFDLMTSEPVAAQKFYAQVFGWKIVPWEHGEKPYAMFAIGDHQIGGSMQMPEDVVAMNIAPHWIGYATVEDVDAVATRANELGGTILKPAWDIPGVGRVAVLADPQGAAFAIFSGASERTMYEGPARQGEVRWNELNTVDYESAWSFYSALLGWEKSASTELGEPIGTYFMFTTKGEKRSMGGMSNVAKVMEAPAHWLQYFHVDDLTSAMEEVAAAGGSVLDGPMEVPGGDWIAHCKDPQGADFALVANSEE